MLRIVFLVSLNLMKKSDFRLYSITTADLYILILQWLYVYRFASTGSTLKLDNKIFRRTCIYEKFWLQIQTQIYATISRTVHRIESCYATFNNLRRLWSTLYSGNIRAPIYILDYNPLLRSNILTTLDRIFISRVTRALQRHLRIN